MRYFLIPFIAALALAPSCLSAQDAPTAAQFVGPPAPEAVAPPVAEPVTEPAAPAQPVTEPAAAVEDPPKDSTDAKRADAPATVLPPISDLARGVFERGVEARVWPSLVAASLVGAEVTVARFGPVPQEAPDDTTRFQLGGVSAAFTGILLADLAAAGKVRLGDPISAFLPPGASCADERVCAITLERLASGRSGLPALPANLFPRDPRDALRDYGESEIVAFLASYRPTQWPAGSGDSLLGDGLLGWALGRAHGGGYAAALRERVLVPLGLASTDVDDAGLVAGYAGGVAVDAIHYGALVGAGGLRSNARDQLALVKAMLQPNATPLRAALLLARQPRGDDADARGLGWRIAYADGDEHWPIVWQRGESGGHASFVGFRTDRQQGLVLLASSAADVSRLGLAMLEGTGIPAAPVSGPAAGAVALGDYIGLYEVEAGREVVIRASDGALSAQVTGQLAVRLTAGGDDDFATADAAIQIRFERGEGRRVVALRWAERGINVPARRLSGRAPHVERAAYPVDAATLASSCGDYAADASLVARLSCTNDKVQFQLSGSAARTMIAYAPDRFATADGEIELRVVRGADGRASVLVLNLLGRELELPRVVPAAASDATHEGGH
jgi:CubicO group peptidase (beta-lactamase class C family)